MPGHTLTSLLNFSGSVELEFVAMASDDLWQIATCVTGYTVKLRTKLCAEKAVGRLMIEIIDFNLELLGTRRAQENFAFAYNCELPD